MLVADAHVVVDDFTLDVALHCADGELVAIVGPNGAGKTTLLRAIAGLEPLRSGRITVDDVRIDDVPAYRRGIGLVPQSDLLMPHLDVLANVAFGSDRETAREFIDVVGMSASERRRPAALSGGQRKRIAIARALARRPRVLLLDEPFEGLDVATRADIRRVVASSGGMRLLVSHHPVDALALADRVVVIEGGRVVQDAAPSELSAHPRSRYVADLVGTNLYRGTFAGAVLHADGGAEIVTAQPSSGDGFVTIHPRAVSLFCERPEGSPRNVWAGRITDIDEQTDRVRVRIDGDISIVAELTHEALGALELGRGSSVYASVKATEIAVG